MGLSFLTPPGLVYSRSAANSFTAQQTNSSARCVHVCVFYLQQLLPDLVELIPISPVVFTEFRIHALLISAINVLRFTSLQGFRLV